MCPFFLTVCLTISHGWREILIIMDDYGCITRTTSMKNTRSQFISRETFLKEYPDISCISYLVFFRNRVYFLERNFDGIYILSGYKHCPSIPSHHHQDLKSFRIRIFVQKTSVISLQNLSLVMMIHFLSSSHDDDNDQNSCDTEFTIVIHCISSWRIRFLRKAVLRVYPF